MTNETLLSLRDAGAALNISRKKLLRMIRDGLPVTRRSERVYVDVTVARQWAAEHQTDGAHTAPALHPSDPRYREKLFAARLDWLRAALDAGVMIRIDDAEARVADVCTKFRTALLQLPSQFAVGDFGTVDDAIQGLLADCSLRDWPAPTSVVSPPPGLAEAPGELTFAARYAESDPRHAYHMGRAARAEAEFNKLAESLISLEDLLTWSQATYQAMERRLKRISARVDPNDIVASLEREIFAALRDISSWNREDDSWMEGESNPDDA